MAEVQKWGQDPEMNRHLAELEVAESEAQRAKEHSALALAILTIKATKVVAELLEDEDPQVRARAADLVYSRTIPKVAAKHVEQAVAIESADTASLRESILDIVKKRTGSDG